MSSTTINDWDTFLAEATDVFVTKNTDYDSRFMKALVHYQAERGPEAARTIWAWEVEKKLDRCRTWITRGELLVKDEGVRNSVVDLFNYTVQYRIFRWHMDVGTDPFKALNQRDFFKTAAMIQPGEWLNYLMYAEGLIRPEEIALRLLILNEMLGSRTGVNG